MDKAEEQIKKESSRSFRKFPGLKDRREKESDMFAGQPLNESKYDKKTAAKFLFRRVTKEELDEEFEENYKYFRDFWGQLTHKDKPFSEFKRIYITYIMDSIHGKLVDGFLDTKDETGELYDNVLKIIDEIYGDRIAKLWTQKTGKRV